MATTKALKKENEELRQEISELQKKIDKISVDISRRNEKSEGIHNGGHVTNMLEQEKSLEFISAKYDELVLFRTNTITELNQIKSEVNVISQKCEKIANSIEQLEEYSYQFNVKIVGMPQEQQTETADQTSKLCIDLFHKIGAEVTLQDIDIAHRVPSRRPGNHANAIICKFVRRLARENVMAARKKANDLQPRISIYDHLTPRLQELLYEAKKWQRANHFKFCWAKNKMVYLRKSENEGVMKLKNLQDLNALSV